MKNISKLLLIPALVLPFAAANAAWEVKYDFDSEADIAGIAEVTNVESSGADASVENGYLKLSHGGLFESTSNLYALLPLGVDLAAASVASQQPVTVYFEIVQPLVNGNKAIVDIVWGLSNVDSDEILTTRYDSFNGMARINVGTDNYESRNGSEYVVHEPLQGNVTYRFWWVIYYNLNAYDIYVQGGQWADQTLLGTGFYGFRSNPGEGQTVDQFLFALSAGSIASPKGRDFTYADNIAIDLAGENLTNPPGTGGGGETWAAWSDSTVDGWVDTGSFLGVIYFGTNDGWIYVQSLSKWIYLPESYVTAEGAWGYSPR